MAFDSSIKQKPHKPVQRRLTQQINMEKKVDPTFRRTACMILFDLFPHKNCECNLLGFINLWKVFVMPCPRLNSTIPTSIGGA